VHDLCMLVHTQAHLTHAAYRKWEGFLRCDVLLQTLIIYLL
jgi:hypothetical protein